MHSERPIPVTMASEPATHSAWQRMPLLAFASELRQHARMVNVDKGGSVFLIGQVPAQMYFVARGEAVLTRTDRGGRVLTLQRARSGFLAEASLRGQRYHCDATALTALELIALPIAAMRHAIDQHATTRWAWISMLSAEIRHQRGHAERLALKTVRERLLHLLVAQGEDGRFVCHGSKKELAAELGVSHEALYRTLTALKREGVLEEDAGAFSLL